MVLVYCNASKVYSQCLAYSSIVIMSKWQEGSVQHFLQHLVRHRTNQEDCRILYRIFANAREFWYITRVRSFSLYFVGSTTQISTLDVPFTRIDFLLAYAIIVMYMA